MYFNFTRKALVACFVGVIKIALFCDRAYDLVDDCKHLYHAVTMVFSVDKEAPATGKVQHKQKGRDVIARALLFLKKWRFVLKGTGVYGRLRRSCGANICA